MTGTGGWGARSVSVATRQVASYWGSELQMAYERSDLVGHVALEC